MYKKMVQDAAEAGGGIAPAKLRHALKQDEWIVARFWVEDPHLITCGMFVSVTFTVALVSQVFPCWAMLAWVDGFFSPICLEATSPSTWKVLQAPMAENSVCYGKSKAMISGSNVQ